MRKRATQIIENEAAELKICRNFLGKSFIIATIKDVKAGEIRANQVAYAVNKWVLENPDSISKNVLNRGLDTGTAFEILSIDIADVDVGENIGAQLQVAQAEANKNMAQAQAEIRRAAAVALEQEMQAKVQEMQAKVVEAQAEVPLAMAEAFRKGKLGVMDYMRFKNIESDTDMRKSIADPGGES